MTTATPSSQVRELHGAGRFGKVHFQGEPHGLVGRHRWGHLGDWWTWRIRNFCWAKTCHTWSYILQLFKFQRFGFPPLETTEINMKVFETSLTIWIIIFVCKANFRSWITGQRVERSHNSTKALPGEVWWMLMPIPVSGDNAAGIQPTNHYHSISIRCKFQSWFHGHLIGAPGTPKIWWPSQHP